MLLKRIYRSDGSLDHVKVLRAGARQNFSPSVLTEGFLEGWLTASDGEITFQGPPLTVYRVLRTPGFYCRHCDARPADTADAQAHSLAAHGEPSAYERLNHYECERGSDG